MISFFYFEYISLNTIKELNMKNFTEFVTVLENKYEKYRKNNIKNNSRHEFLTTRKKEDEK